MTDQARLPFVDDPAEPAATIFAGLRERGGSAPNLYRILAHSPSLLKAWVDLAWPLRRSKDTPRGLRELAITYLAVRRRTDYVATHHRHFASRHGVSDSQLDGLEPDGWKRDAGFDDGQRLVLTLVDEVFNGGSASEATIASLDSRFGSAGAVELVVTIAFYEAVCVVNRSFAIPVEPVE